MLHLHLSTFLQIISQQIRLFSRARSLLLHINTRVVVRSNELLVPVTSHLAAGNHSFTITGLVFGPPTIGSATGIKIETTLDMTSEGSPSGYIGGQVTGVSMRINSVDHVPFLQFASEKTVTFTFTTETNLIENDFVAINYPSGLFLNVPPVQQLCMTATVSVSAVLLKCSEIIFIFVSTRMVLLPVLTPYPLLESLLARRVANHF